MPCRRDRQVPGGNHLDVAAGGIALDRARTSEPRPEDARDRGQRCKQEISRSRTTGHQINDPGRASEDATPLADPLRELQHCGREAVGIVAGLGDDTVGEQARGMHTHTESLDPL
jgi:hypothetical protein